MLEEKSTESKMTAGPHIDKIAGWKVGEHAGEIMTLLKKMLPGIFQEVLLLLGLLAVLVAIRIPLLPYLNTDIAVYLPWFRYLSDHGGLYGIKDLLTAGIAGHAAVYPPPIFYQMAALTPLMGRISPVVLVKSICIVFDVLCAFAFYLIVREDNPYGKAKYLAFLLAGLAPVTVICSAYWGQFDSQYCSFLLFMLYFLKKKANNWAMVSFATALAFKYQALILAPLLVILFLRRVIGWKQLAVIPAVFFLWMVPAYLTGCPLTAPLTLLMNGAREFDALTMNAPSLFALIPVAKSDTLALVGMAATACVCGWIIWKATRYQVYFGEKQVVLCSVLVAMCIPYFLPRMHDRYFYPAALLSILLVFNWPRLKVIPLVLQCTCLLSFLPFLRGYELIPLAVPAVVNGIVIIVLAREFNRSLKDATG
jgi:Gpi18-like mannosyltransferase